MWHGGGQRDPELLAECYRDSLALAAEHGCRSLAFPAISTGVYGYPRRAAAEIAVTAVRAAHPTLERIVFCCFDRETEALYRTLLTG